jgi:hypothetical protein
MQTLCIKWECGKTAGGCVNDDDDYLNYHFHFAFASFSHCESVEARAREELKFCGIFKNEKFFQCFQYFALKHSSFNQMVRNVGTLEL